MRILSILFAVLSTAVVSAGIAHHPQHLVSQHLVPGTGPTPICPSRHCAIGR